MAAAPTDALVDELRRHRLLEPVQLDEAARLVGTGLVEPKALADELVRRGWLTSYQADQLLQGRGKDLVLGACVLLEPLGEGGMSQVFKARQQKLGRVVAVKVLRKERLANAETVRRFQRELRALASLSHPNIVTAYGADEVRGAHMLVMEYVEGATDLAALVKKNGPLPVREACDYVRQAALGLQHAHERGLVHRDVKPHNLLVCAGGKTVKILDLGLARLDDGADAETSGAVTKEGAVLGSPDYLSPEQAQHMHSVDIRADLYSLGCTFYFLLAGRPPFPGGSFFDKVYRHRFEEPEPLEALRPDAPPAVVAVVRKLMAKQREDRFGTPAEVASAVAALLAGETAAAAISPAPAVAAAADSASAHTAGHSDTAAAPPALVRRRRKPSYGRGLLYAASAGLCVVVGVCALALVPRLLPSPHRTPEQPKPAPAAGPPPAPATEVFQDFESGTYGDWKTTGAAFGDKPVYADRPLPRQKPVTGYGGEFYVSSFVGGDKTIGKLTSPEFTIRHPYIRFRIGGGSFPNQECINLLVGGKVVRTATAKAPSAEKLEWAFWDVKELQGKKATIEVVDLATVAWGHINIDDVIFTDEAPP